MIPVLTTERLTLRAPEMADFDAYAAFYASDRAIWVGGQQDTRLAFKTFAALLGHWHLRGFGWWMIEHDGNPAGFSGVSKSPANANTEIGWVLFEGHEGRGFAREAAAAALGYARRMLELTRLVSYIETGHIRSENVAVALGARRVGVADHNAELAVWDYELEVQA